MELATFCYRDLLYTTTLYAAAKDDAGNEWRSIPQWMLQPAATLTIAENSRREERRLGTPPLRCEPRRVACLTQGHRHLGGRRPARWCRTSSLASRGGSDWSRAAPSP